MTDAGWTSVKSESPVQSLAATSASTDQLRHSNDENNDENNAMPAKSPAPETSYDLPRAYGGRKKALLLETPKREDSSRKPFNLVVNTNVPISPRNDEFYSPKHSATSKLASTQSQTQKQFGFEESFDDDEFFDAAMM